MIKLSPETYSPASFGRQSSENTTESAPASRKLSSPPPLVCHPSRRVSVLWLRKKKNLINCHLARIKYQIMFLDKCLLEYFLKVVYKSLKQTNKRRCHLSLRPRTQPDREGMEALCTHLLHVLIAMTSDTLYVGRLNNLLDEHGHHKA